MPKNSAQRESRLPIWRASKPPCARAGTIPSLSVGASAGKGLSVAAFVQDRLPQPGLVVETERRHHRPLRVHRVDQSLSLQRYPDRRIAQSAGVAGGDDGIAEVEMIAVRIGRAYWDARVLGWPGIAG